MTRIVFAALLAALLGFTTEANAVDPPAAKAPAAKAVRELKVGMIGLDTSHVGAFTALLNDTARPDRVPGARVVAGFKGGSPDVESSASRVDKFTADLQAKWQVKIVDSIDELLRLVDVVMIESVDGRTHLAQVRPVFAAHKRVFIDKPLAAGYKDAKEIVQLSRKTGTPFFSASSMRWVPEFLGLAADAKVGGVLGAFTYGPATLEPHHADLFWYGIHTAEILWTVMGPGCVGVTRAHTDGADVVIGRWRDGRLGTMRGIRDGAHPYGAIAFGKLGVVKVEPEKTDYRAMLVEVVKFFQTGKPPVAPEETLEIMAFMQAADLSKARNGAEVTLQELDK